MSAEALGLQVRARQGRGAGDAVVMGVFAGTLLLSAFLLFSVQPVFAKMVLPALGGSPSVWAISMCFFQAVLLLGYLYAYLLNRFLAPGWAPAVHLMVLAGAALTLPFGLPAEIDPPAGDAYLWLIGVLAQGVGLPFFAISATAPLLQAWFARTGHPHANDPYFLYGASNLGSLAALIAYPLTIEPVLGLSRQSGIWTTGFMLLAGCIMVAGAVMVMRLAPQTPARQETRGPTRAVAMRERLTWIALSFVPSGLLVAFSSYVTTDVASAPFIWVIPLAVFLATFILVFRDKPLISHRALLLLQPAIVAMALTGLAIAGQVGWAWGAVAGFAAFFVTTMVAHRELFERRPEPQHLTQFYLWMSLGGVLGGVFAAIIAPQIFNALYEFPLLLVLGMLCRPGLFGREVTPAEDRTTWRLATLGVVTLVALSYFNRAQVLPHHVMSQIALVVILAGGVLMLLTREQPVRQALAAALTGLTLWVLPTAMTLGESERSFFGVHRVVTEPAVEADGRITGEARVLLHGTTMHGIERVKDANMQPLLGRPVPSSYYHPESPMRRALEAAREMRNAAGGRFSVGVVGLGAGSMACYAKPGDNWRLYEIDPVVVKIARTAFSFLPKCLPDADVVVGDARLTVAKEPAGRFDYLVIDAFSSDSVPVHLLTREALQLYLGKLAENGLLVLHISNRHLDLDGVASAVAASIPGVHGTLVLDRTKPSIDASGSSVLVLAKSAEALAPVKAWKEARPMQPDGTTPWTDDYSNILAALIRNYR